MAAATRSTPDYTVIDVPSGDSAVYLQGIVNHVTGGNGNVTVTGSTGATTIALGNGNDIYTIFFILTFLD